MNTETKVSIGAVVALVVFVLLAAFGAKLSPNKDVGGSSRSPFTKLQRKGRKERQPSSK